MDTSINKEPFVNLRIRAYIRTEIIADKYLPLDAVLYYHAVRDKFGEQVITEANKSNVQEYGEVVLPILKKMQKTDNWFYSCSFAQWSEGTKESQGFYTKRFDTQKASMLTNSQKVETSKGRYKNYHNKVYTFSTNYVDWYVVAQKSKLEELLKFCTHLGKKTSQGFGRVHKWEIKEWAEDWSVRGEGNKLMRAVPLKNPSEKSIIYGIRPSYWLEKHQVPVLLP